MSTTDNLNLLYTSRSSFLVKESGGKQLSIMILIMHFVIRAIQAQVSVIGVLTHRPEGHDNSLLQGSDLIRSNSN